MYTIFGATGHIGSRTAEILLKRGERVRVVGRNAHGLQRLVTKGAEAAVGDLQDGAFVTSALAGTTAVFALLPPDYRARDFRAFQNHVGMNIASGIQNSGVSHVVNLSSQGADLPAGTGPILGLRDQEERLNALHGVNVLHLRPTYFMENLLMSIPLIHQRGIAGSAVRGDFPFAMIATRDIADRVAGRLLKRDFSDKTVEDLLGERDLSLNEAFSVIGGRIGRPGLKYVRFSDAEATQGLAAMGLSADVIRLFIEMSKSLSEGRFAVNRPRTHANTTPTSIEAFAATFAEAYAHAAPHQAA